MVLAGMIFIESYGDPLAKSPTGPAGIAQMTKGSAKEMGLSTGKRVRIGSKAVKKTRWVGTGTNRRKVVQTVQQPVYKTVDERYVPERAIWAMARRVSNRRSWLGGKVEFAIAEYHMGAGRMAKLLSAYFGRRVKVSEVSAQMRDADLSYQELFWTNTPYFRPAVYQALDDLNRRHSRPLFPRRRRCSSSICTASRLSYHSSHPRIRRFGVRLRAAVSFGRPLPFSLPEAPVAGELHQDLSERFVLLPDITSHFGVRPAAHEMSAERSTIGSALFVAHHLKRLQGERYSGFAITRMLAHGDEREDDESFPLHGLGWAFDVPSVGLSKTEQRDLKFILTDLRQAGLLAYIEDARSRPSRRPAIRFTRAVRAVLLVFLAGNVPADSRGSQRSFQR